MTPEEADNRLKRECPWMTEEIRKDVIPGMEMMDAYMEQAMSDAFEPPVKTFRISGTPPLCLMVNPRLMASGLNRARKLIRKLGDLRYGPANSD